MGGCIGGILFKVGGIYRGWNCKRGSGSERG